MTRGRLPTRALALATGIAERRGEVQSFLRAPGLICNFVIYLAGLVAHVRVMRVRNLRHTLASLERELGDALAGLRRIVSSPAISRELWICSPRGLFRFFRIESSKLTELDRDGKPLPIDASFSRKRENPGTGKKPAVTSGKVSGAPRPEASMRVPTVTGREPVLAGVSPSEKEALQGIGKRKKPDPRKRPLFQNGTF